MKIKRIALMLALIVITAITLTACGKNPNPRLTIEPGAYGYDSAIATNIATGEVIELGQEVMQTNLHPWWWLTSISVWITAEDKFTDNELTKGGRTYHLVAKNTLKTYIEDHTGWAVEVTMGKHKVYG